MCEAGRKVWGWEVTKVTMGGTQNFGNGVGLVSMGGGVPPIMDNPVQDGSRWLEKVEEDSRSLKKFNKDQEGSRRFRKV